MFGLLSKKNRDEKQAAAYAALVQSGVRNENLHKELFEALDKGYFKTAEQIMLLGTTVKSLDEFRVVLIQKGNWDEDITVWDFLIKDVVDSDRRNFEKVQRVLNHEVVYGDKRCVEFLLQHGIKPQDDDLKVAIEKGYVEIVRLLIQYGASKVKGGEYLAAASKNLSLKRGIEIMAALDIQPIKKPEPVVIEQAPEKLLPAASPDEVVIESQLAGQPRKEVYSFTRMERVTFFGKDVPPLRETFNQLGRRDEGLKAAIAEHNQRGGEHTIDSMFGRHIEKHFVDFGGYNVGLA